MTSTQKELRDNRYMEAKIRFILDKYYISNPEEADDADINMSIADLMQLIQSREAELESKHSREIAKAKQEPVGAAIEIKVPSETMQAVMSRIKMTDKSIAARVLEPQWRVERWRNGTADQYDLEIEQWKLRVLASLTHRFNWAVFLLQPETLKKVKALQPQSNKEET